MRKLPDPEQAVPDPKAQRNFTDPESRIMPDGSHKGSFVQGYNAQIAVDGKAQVIVAAEVTQQSNDKQQLVPMLEQVKKNVGAQPEAASADNGYWNTGMRSKWETRGSKVSTCTWAPGSRNMGSRVRRRMRMRRSQPQKLRCWSK